MLKRLLAAFGICALAWLAGTPSPAPAAEPLKIVVAFAPGGGSDLIARVLGKSLSDSLGRPVVVENMPGAFGVVAGRHVANAGANDHTLMLGTTGTLPIPVAMGVNLPYDTLEDFAPITQVGLTPIVLVVNPSLPAKTFEEFASTLKASPPDSFFYGTWGVGSVGHFAGELLKLRAHLAMTHVPYKGSGPLVSDLIAGHVKIGFLESSTALPHVRSGQLRALAVASPRRAPLLPDVPTFSEVGVKFDEAAWYGIVGSKSMPAAEVARLSASLREALNSKEVKEKLLSMGVAPTATSPGEFGKILQNDVAVWSQVARAASIKAD